MEIASPRTLKFIEVSKHNDLDDANFVATIRDFADLKHTEALEKHRKLKSENKLPRSNDPLFSSDPTADFDDQVQSNGRGENIVPRTEREAFREILAKRKQIEAEEARKCKRRNKANDDNEEYKLELNEPKLS